jgi:prepilin-type N-terminal cleavage/methylation domain-containing protein
MMDKLHCAKGFTLLECLLVLCLLSIFPISGPILGDIFLYRSTEDEIVHTQTTSLFLRTEQSAHIDEKIEHFDEVRFNEKGNVSVAQTLRFKNNRKIVIMLGPGRQHD